MDGGYDVGYKDCPCFWGVDPGSLVKRLTAKLGTVEDLLVLDAGCGEGKNAVYLANLGAKVYAIDISKFAIANARTAWPTIHKITWDVADIRDISFPKEEYDIVIAYGLLHCMAKSQEIMMVVSALQEATKRGGYNLICSFNSRYHELSAHNGFSPCFTDHETYLELYRGWEIIESSDSDLTEVHPHNNLRHTHSMTRIIARKYL